MKTIICFCLLLGMTACSWQNFGNGNRSALPEHQEEPRPEEPTGQTETSREEAEKETNDGSSEQTVLLDVPLIAQNPELKYGCEVTSLAMLLQYAGVQVDKMKLAAELPKDEDPVKKNKNGDITQWGNPDHGFVGDITGKQAGYAVYAGPMERLMARYLPGRTVNLTGKPFDEVIAQLQEKKPVVLWTTGDYRLPDRWESWKHGQEEIKTPLDLHAVVLVGYDPDHLYVNDPLTGKKAHPVNRQQLIDSWIALGKQALSYR